ncbi:MAG: hypothetical protein IPJ47_15355 [Anaerolineales bacterium]|nr:hypothetical protein [Anaerolineales bacterium]
MATTDDLVISLRADVSQLQKSLEDVSEQLVATQGASIATTQAMSSGFNRAANAALFLKSAIVAATAAAATLLATTNNGVREFNSLANSLNLTYNQLARLRSVSEGANLETDMMIDLAKTLNEQIGEAANGNKDFEESFARLGLSMSDLTKLGVDEQLITVTDALGKVSSQADKAQIGATLFGDNWLPALKLTEVNVKALVNEFDNLLPKIDDLDVSRAIEADKEFDKLIANLRTTTEIVSSDLSPAFTVATRNLNALFNVDPGELNDNIDFTTFASIELGAQLINIFTAVSGIVKIIAASVGTLGNMIVMGLGVPVAGVMDIYNTNVAFFTNLLIKTHNAYKSLKGEKFEPIELVKINKTEMIDELVKTVKDTKAVLQGLATDGIADFASGIGGEAGAAFRDAGIEEANKVKNKNKTGEPTTPKGGGDDGDAAKKADELRKAAQELLKQTLESNMSESQLQFAHQQDLLKQLKDFYDKKALTASEYQAGVLAANASFESLILKQMMDDFAKENALILEKQTAEDEYRTNRVNSIQQVIEESRRGGLTELELLDEQHAKKMAKQAKLQEGEVILKDELKQAELQAEAQHQAKRLDLILGTGSKIQDMNKAFQKGNLQGALSFFAADFGGMSQHSRKMFELTKAARLADAAMAIPSTVIEAARQGSKIGGWPLGAAMGAAALASQLGQLRAIQSATFAGGGSAGGGGGGVGVGASGAASAEPQQQQPIMQRFVNVSVFGEENTMYSRDSVLKLMQRIGEEVKDGAVLRVV